jgi:hypothetical protein
MSEQKYDASAKWGAPTSSYEDAKAMSNFLKAQKEKQEVEKNEQKET